MEGQIITLLGPHPVYGSAKWVLSELGRRRGMPSIDMGPGTKGITKFMKNFRTRAIWYMSINPRAENIQVTNSPLLALEAWEALIKNVPLVVYEEYATRGTFKDSLAGIAFRPFGGIPFLSPTKKTCEFLRTQGVMPFLIPPAKKKIPASKKREHILFVGRAEETKNPRLFIKLAGMMKDEQFVFIGKGTLSEEIRAAAKKTKNLEYIPFIEDEKEFLGYYSRAKLLIHPPSSDPIGFVVVEALSASVPVLASSYVGASDFLPKEWVLSNFEEKNWVERAKGILENQKASISRANEAFEHEHLDMADPYFKKVSFELEEAIKDRWDLSKRRGI